MKLFSFKPGAHNKYEPKELGSSSGLNISHSVSGIVRFQFHSTADSTDQIVIELTREEGQQAYDFLKSHFSKV